MEVVWWLGSSHSSVKANTTAQHLLRMRESPGRGAEAVGSDRLEAVEWRAGSLEYLPAGADHQHATTVASDWIAVSFSEAEWEEFSETVASEFSGPVACGAGRRHPKSSRAIRCLRAARGQGDDDEAAVIEFARELVRHLGSGATEQRRGGIAPAALRRVMDFVEGNLAQPLKVEALAKLAGMSPYYFISAFEATVGQTPHQFVLSRRVALARHLLERRPSMKVVDIAFECGFASHAHLCAVFAERYRLQMTLLPRSLERNCIGENRSVQSEKRTM